MTRRLTGYAASVAGINFVGLAIYIAWIDRQFGRQWFCLVFLACLILHARFGAHTIPEETNPQRRRRARGSCHDWRCGTATLTPILIDHLIEHLRGW